MYKEKKKIGLSLVQPDPDAELPTNPPIHVQDGAPVSTDMTDQNQNE